MSDESVEQLRERREVWRNKYAIRACYARWHAMLRPWARPGKTLEVGAGAGLMKELWGEGLVSTDILETPWIDFPLDALDMNLPESSYENLLCIDALHHFKDPHIFIDQGARVIADGGRMLFVEPWISPASFLGYKLLHHEEIWFKDYHHPEASRDDPWAGNLALPNLVFGREMKHWPQRHPEWKLVQLKRFSLLDFQVAGGFKPWALVGSKPLYDLCLKIDDWLGFAMPLLAFRMMAVFERVPRAAGFK